MYKNKYLKYAFIVGLSLGLVALFATILTPVREDVRGKSPALPVSTEMTEAQQLAQDLALTDSRVIAYTTGRPSEVFGVHFVRDHFPASSKECAAADCRQVEIYNYDENATVTAIVNLDTRQVVDVLHQPGTHPKLNQRMMEIAIEVLLNTPELTEIIGFQPEAEDIMPMEGDYNGTTCSGEHLCASATFRVGEQMLWATVDLSEQKFAGFGWTNLPYDEPDSAELFTPQGCPPSGIVTQGGWVVSHEITDSDGLRIYNVTYNGTPVITSAKLVEQHADYGGYGYRDATGCSPNGGYPIYPYGDTVVYDLLGSGSQVIGFEVMQDFRMGNWGNGCNYRYEQRFQFYYDGSFRVAQGAYGRGCGSNALYRPLVRIDIAVNGDDNNTFSRWNGSVWEDVVTENYLTPYADAGHGPHEINPDGYSWKIENTTGGGYYIEQDVGQFETQNLIGVPAGHDAGRGAAPFLYVVQHHANEGDTDLGGLGDCCNDDHQQGPHIYVDGEPTQDTNLVIWYIPQEITDVTGGSEYCWTITGEPNPETYPCFAGPMFIPTIPISPTAGFIHNGPIGAGSSAVFTNTTIGRSLSYAWDFGDGAGTSTLANPVYTYTQEGTFTVTLSVSNTSGSDTYSDTIDVYTPVVAAFTYSEPVIAGIPVGFVNLSSGEEPLSYVWDFGDGATSTETNPQHTFAALGDYDVSLTASNSYGSDEVMQQVTVYLGETPTAAFAHDAPTLLGTPTIFTNLSSGEEPLTYLWDFGDGATFTYTHPQHSYAMEGTYAVTLTATNLFGTSTMSDTVLVGASPQASFEQNGLAFLQGETTIFTNTTTGSEPIAYVWDFGDGITSTETSPQHTYATTGTFTVTLTTTNTFGADLAFVILNVGDSIVAGIEVIEGNAGDPGDPVSHEGLTVTFINLSKGADSFLWDFGDGITSTQASPTHTYAVPGLYTVSLTAFNETGSYQVSIGLHVWEARLIFIPLLVR